MNFAYEKLDLPNGIRVRAVKIPNSPTVTFAVLVGAGSRNESPELSGIAHFIEHNVFKGTPSLPSSQIVSDTIERIGGVQNAFTAHEFTGFWAKASAGKLSILQDVVSDIFLNPLFPEKDLEIERGNVIEELNMRQDDPPKKILLDLLHEVFDGHSLGQDIIGTKESLMSLKREDLIKFREDFYDPGKIVVIAAGNFNEDDFFAKAEHSFSKFGLGKSLKSTSYITTQNSPQVIVKTRQLDQAHIILGYRGLSSNDPRYRTWQVTNELFGSPASLSSRLFHKIREELGLAYYISSEEYDFTDTGMWLVRAGVTVSRVQEAIKAIMDEAKLLSTQLVSSEELNRAKEHLKGVISFGLESSDNVMEFFGLQEVTVKQLDTPEDVIKKIDAVTAEEILTLSRELINNNQLTIAALGPFEVESEKEKIMKIIGY